MERKLPIVIEYECGCVRVNGADVIECPLHLGIGLGAAFFAAVFIFLLGGLVVG